jgi:hypothetical protein
MNVPVTKEDLAFLIREHNEPCISVYLPTLRLPSESKQNLIRFKNLTSQAEKELLGRGYRAADVGTLLKPAQEMTKDTLFWQQQSDGMAAFLSPDLFRYFRLPAPFPEIVIVGHRFHLKPLFPLLSDNGRFYILTLSQNQVRLLQGSRFGVEEVELQGVPKSLAEALKYDNPESQLQFHTRTPPGAPGGGQRPAMFHGQGVGIDESKINILRFFQQVDKGLQKKCGDEKVPLVLAGVEYLLPIYQQANSYPQLIREGIRGNPEEVSDQDLKEQAWGLLEPYFKKGLKEAVEHYRERLGTGRASKDLPEIVSGAYHGRVEALFVSVGEQRWGTYDPDRDRVRIEPEAKPGTEDLLDFAAVHTYLKGGKVFAVPPSEMPDAGPLAALFRY